MFILGFLFWMGIAGILLHVGALIVDGKLWLATKRFAGLFVYNAFQCAIIGHFFFGIPFKRSFPALVDVAKEMPGYAWTEFIKPFVQALWQSVT